MLLFKKAVDVRDYEYSSILNARFDFLKIHELCLILHRGVHQLQYLHILTKFSDSFQKLLADFVLNEY